MADTRFRERSSARIIDRILSLAVINFEGLTFTSESKFTNAEQVGVDGYIQLNVGVCIPAVAAYILEKPAESGP